MKYLELIEQFVMNSTIYREFLKKMPAPFNNPYFDTVLLILLVLYLLYRIWDRIRVRRYRARVRKLQKRENQKETQRNEELENREQMVTEREERIGRFMDYLDFILRSCSRRQETAENRQTYTSSKPNGLRKHDYLLEYGGEPEEVSEYDVILDEMIKEDLKHASILKTQEASRRKAEQRMRDLDVEVRIEEFIPEESAAPKKRRWRKVAKDEKE